MDPLRNFKFTVDYGDTRLGVMKITGLHVNNLEAGTVHLTSGYTTDSALLEKYKRGDVATVVIRVHGSHGGVTFTLKNVKPVGLEFSELDSGANALLLHTLELAHEGVTVE